MNNAFAINNTVESAPVSPADAFLRRRINAALSDKIDDHFEDVVADVSRRFRSVPHFIGMGISAVVVAVCSAMLEESEQFSLPWLFGTIIGMVALSLVVWSYNRRISTDSDESQLNMAQAEEYGTMTRRELGIPDTAADLDVLGYFYKVSKGKEKRTRMDNEDYDALDMYVFIEDGHLMLADGECLYAFPLSSITVRRREQKTRIFCWNKDTMPNQEPYKSYRIKYDEENDVFTVRCVYALELAASDCEILVPDYEWERTLQPMLGLPVTEA